MTETILDCLRSQPILEQDQLSEGRYGFFDRAWPPPRNTSADVDTTLAETKAIMDREEPMLRRASAPLSPPNGPDEPSNRP